MFKAKMKVKLTKLLASRNAIFPPGDPKSFVAGSPDNPGVSLPIDYTLEGTLVNDIVVGSTVQIFRTKRNEVEFPGFFESSTVSQIGDEGFTTQNSVYKVEILK